jgi:hypothetical protein
VNATELKAALNRAGETQGGLARRLGRSRSMVTDWVDRDHVPPEWVDLVHEALGLPVPRPALERFDSLELLDELRRRILADRGDGPHSGRTSGEFMRETTARDINKPVPASRAAWTEHRPRSRRQHRDVQGSAHDREVESSQGAD